LNYLQCIALSSNFPLNWPAGLMQMFNIQGQISSPGDLLMHPECWTSEKDEIFMGLHSPEYAKILLFAIAPLIAIAILLAGYWASFFCMKRANKKEKSKTLIQVVPAAPRHDPAFDGLAMKNQGADYRKRRPSLPQLDRSTSYTSTREDKFYCSAMTILFLLYPTLVKKSFMLFSSRKIGYSRFWKYDYDILMISSIHQKWMYFLGVPMLFGYAVGFPVLAAAFIRRMRAQSKLRDPSTKMKYGMLYHGYRGEMAEWEAAISLRKVAIIAVTVFTDVVDLQVFLVVFVLSIFVLFHIFARPYEDDQLQLMELQSLFVSIITMYFGLLFFKEWVTDIARLVLTIFLIIINALFMTHSCVKLGRELYKENIEKQTIETAAVATAAIVATNETAVSAGMESLQNIANEAERVVITN